MRLAATHILLNPRRRACALGTVVLIALGAGSLAGAGGAQAVSRPVVSFPTPGAMEFSRLPAQIRSGHHFTMRGVMPLAIFGGDIHLQSETATGGWTTLVSAKVSPKVFWIHWMVPKPLRGTQMQVRFVLDGRGQLLATSPTYAIAVSP